MQFVELLIFLLTKQGIRNIIFGESSNSPLSPVASFASNGALEVMNFYSVFQPNNFIQELKNSGFFIFGTAQNELSHHQVIQKRVNNIQTQNLLLVLGSEGSGISEEITLLCDDFLCIKRTLANAAFPGSLVDSLNVAVASGIIIEALTNKANKKLN